MGIRQVTDIQFIAVLLLGLISCSNSTPVSTKSIEPQPTTSSPNPVNPSSSPSPSPNSNTLPIADLQKAPRQSTVTLRGKVGQQVAIVGGTVYELQDATGSVWVLSRQPVGQLGEEVTLRGVVRYQSIPLNGKEQGSVYVEQVQPAQG